MRAKLQEEKSVRGDLIISLQLLKETDDMDKEQFFKRCRNEANRGHNMK